MAKMSQYTPLDENDKEYFFGEGEGAVVTVGETNASSGKVNRLVKLSDIGGGGGDVPNAGKGIEYDANTNTLSFYYNGSGGFTTELNSSNHEMMKVKAGVGIEVDNKGVSIDTQHANEGDVLTYHKNGSTDEVVWAAPGGGGSSLPEYTTDDENKVLGVFVDRVWDRQSYKYVITGTHLGWKEGIPEFPNLGSGGEWGLEPVVKLSYKYNDESEEYEMSTEAGAAGCPYNTFGENGDAQYGTWRFKEWQDYGDNPYSVVNNTYVAEIDNNWFINFGYLKDGYDPDPESPAPSEHPDANSILFKVKHHGAIIPFVCIEFINESGKSLTVSVESEETGGGFGETMVPITDNGVSVNNVIPNNTFVQITVLGHGYTIKTQSTELPVH